MDTIKITGSKYFKSDLLLINSDNLWDINIYNKIRTKLRNKLLGISYKIK